MDGLVSVLDYRVHFLIAAAVYDITVSWKIWDDCKILSVRIIQKSSSLIESIDLGVLLAATSTNILTKLLTRTVNLKLKTLLVKATKTSSFMKLTPDMSTLIANVVLRICGYLMFITWGNDKHFSFTWSDISWILMVKFWKKKTSAPTQFFAVQNFAYEKIVRSL